jgi:hypothetical protein
VVIMDIIHHMNRCVVYFLARVPGFKMGYQGPGFSSIHLYELMCYLLKIDPVDNSGHLDSTRIYLTAE